MSKGNHMSQAKGPETSADTRTQKVMIVRGGERLCAGYVCFYAAQCGWQFLPQFQAKKSRKYWPTASAALKGRVDSYTLEPVPPRSAP